MYFLIIMAFAFVLSDGLPPAGCNFIRGSARTIETATLSIAVGQVFLAALAALMVRRRVFRELRGAEDHRYEDAAEALSRGQQFILAVLSVLLIGTMICTPWTVVVREGPHPSPLPGGEGVLVGWGLGRYPLVGDVCILLPLFASLFLIWGILYPVEQAIRFGSGPADGGALDEAQRRPESGLRAHLLDKFRHQVLVIASPMVIIVFAKFFTDKYEELLRARTHLPWISDALLGTISICVLIISPALLRFAWSTKRLADGPLRDRFVRTCRRIGLRYREILLWNTHHTAINAAVMGFVPQLRYILVSDALLATMKEEEIEAVFGHEAGHVRHWHLQYFGLFAILSMYVSGGVLEILFQTRWVTDFTWLNLSALVVLLACWLFGFGWLSRKFERQADLFGVRCLAPDVASCVEWCSVHGGQRHEGTKARRHEGSEAVAAAIRLGHEGVGEETGISDLKSRISNFKSQISNSIPQSADLEYQKGSPGEMAGRRQGGADRTTTGSLCVTAANLFGQTLNKIADLNGIPREAKSWRHGSIASRCRLIERFAQDPEALRRFDRGLRWIKIGLIAGTLIGTGAAAWLYYDSVAQAVRYWMRARGG